MHPSLPGHTITGWFRKTAEGPGGNRLMSGSVPAPFSLGRGTSGLGNPAGGAAGCPRHCWVPSALLGAPSSPPVPWTSSGGVEALLGPPGSGQGREIPLNRFLAFFFGFISSALSAIARRSVAAFWTYTNSLQSPLDRFNEAERDEGDLNRSK